MGWMFDGFLQTVFVEKRRVPMGAIGFLVGYICRKRGCEKIAGPLPILGCFGQTLGEQIKQTRAGDLKQVFAFWA